MFWVIVGLVIILSVMLIIMVLLQPSKSGGGMGAAFGSLGTQLGSTFGSRRTLDFLAKGTTWAAGILALLCIIANLAFVPKAGKGGLVPVTQGAKQTAPPAQTLPLNTAQPSAPATQGGGTQGAQPQGNQPAPTQQPATTPAK
jgi:preprotein translocase subunit SecG